MNESQGIFAWQPAYYARCDSAFQRRRLYWPAAEDDVRFPGEADGGDAARLGVQAGAGELLPGVQAEAPKSRARRRVQVHDDRGAALSRAQVRRVPVRQGERRADCETK